MEIKRVGLYCRVSTKDQTVETQLLELRRYGNARGWEITAEQTDEGWSGTKEDRPGLQAILQMARERSIDAVLVWKVDRLGRSVPHLFQVLQELKEIGIAIVGFKDGVDTSQDTPYTRFFFRIMAIVADLDREMIMERTNAGRQRVFSIFEETGKIATKTGLWFGRPRLDVDDVIAEYAEQYVNGMVSLDKVAAAAGCSKPTACRRLKAFQNSPRKGGFVPVGSGSGI
jgi:DNA invertase Pin-like site-specific DNA recombinase